MKNLGISNQIIIVSIIPALIVALILSTHYIWDQVDSISDSLRKNGKLITKQLSPAAEYSIYSGNIELIDPLINTVIKSNPVQRIQVFDKYNNSILDVKKPEDNTIQSTNFLQDLLEKEKHLIFSEPITSAQIPVDDTELETGQAEASNDGNMIGKVVVTLTTKYAVAEKSRLVMQGILITLLILLITILIVVRITGTITQPIKSLTKAVRDITQGDLNTHINKNSSGEIGILQSCINHMTEELKHSQSDMENQLNDYTHELQQTMEELEIRNAELDITRSKAIYANNAKSEFLANMSHEIRTPLSGIIGFTELLNDTTLSNQQKDYTQTIKKSAISLLEIINDILDLSKIESGKTEISTSEFNLVDIIEDIINLLSPVALEKNIELFYRIEKNVPTIIASDPFRIHQIITNLIGNAIKFTDEGYVYLQVTNGEITNAEASIKFTVSDTGIGMNSKDKKKLFRAFTQADTSITRRFGGTGLGLVISRKLTLLMKGEIGFDSTEGEGTTFWFSVPVTAIHEEIKSSELSNKKIAFFSNHFIARQSFKTLLENHQYLVNNYPLASLDNLIDIEKENDIIIVFLSSKEINTRAINISELHFSKPSMLIASTRSHTELRNLQQHNFDNAAFTSEKIERINTKLIAAHNKSTDELNNPDIKEEATDNADMSNVNVMVVDDNDVNLRLAEIILHKHKARVTTARSGAQAIDYACMNTFDIIFMDLHMPGLDGYETTKKIRDITPGKQPVIIALTANALPEEKEKVIQSSMNGILIKPVSDPILQKVISQWVLMTPTDNKGLQNIFGKKVANDSKQAGGTDNTIFSIELAKEFTGNNEELAYELFGMLRDELDNYSTAISSAAKNSNLTALFEQVHKLHGASRCCGTMELKQISSHIEDLINQKINFDINKETSLLLAAIQKVADFKINPGNKTA